MTATASLDRTPPALDGIVAAELAPLVRRIDEEGLYPEAALRSLGAAGAFAAHTAGAPASGLVRSIKAMAGIGATCGASAFCAWCQDAFGWYLVHTANKALQDRLLPGVASGGILGGTGLSNPMKSFSGLDTLALKGTRVAGGWRVSGRLPWVSNLGPNHLFASIFEAEGQRVMAAFDCAQEGLSLVSGGAFVALEGTRTYAVLLREAFVPEAMVLAEEAAPFVARIRQGFVLLQMGMAIGAARGAARQMRTDGAARKLLAPLPVTPEALEDRADALGESVAVRASEALDPGRPAFHETLRLRLDGSRLALDAAEANLIAHGARGYLKGSQADRLRREAHFVAIVSPSIKHILTELGSSPEK